MTEHAALVAAYWEYHRLSTSTRREDRLAAREHAWALDDVLQLASDGESGVIELLVALADGAPDDHALGSLGAGPLEDVIREHGARLADEVDTAARRHERFRRALRGVWFGDAVDPDLVARLRRFGGPPA